MPDWWNWRLPTSGGELKAVAEERMIQPEVVTDDFAADPLGPALAVAHDAAAGRDDADAESLQRTRQVAHPAVDPTTALADAIDGADAVRLGGRT